MASEFSISLDIHRKLEAMEDDYNRSLHTSTTVRSSIGVWSVTRDRNGWHVDDVYETSSFPALKAWLILRIREQDGSSE